MNVRWTLEEVARAGRQSMLHTAAASHTSAWAFGISIGRADNFSTLVFRRQGAEWKHIVAPNIGRVNRAIVASNADVWAVGDGESLHWDGRQWRQIPVVTSLGIDAQLFGLTYLGDGQIWGAGCVSRPDGSGVRGTIQRCMGEKWTTLFMPDLAPDWSLAAIGGMSDQDVWAVGQASGRGIVLHWDGSNWGQITVPVPAGRSGLRDVIAFADDKVLVGGWLTSRSNRLERKPAIWSWDGKSWSAAALPDSSGDISQLVYIDGSIWGIGSASDGTGYMVVCRSNDTWERIPGPRIPKGKLSLHGGAALPGGKLLVIGAVSISSSSIWPFAAVGSTI